MAKIQTAIELQDNFSPVLQNIVGFMNLAMGSMNLLQDTLDRPFEAASLQGMQDYVNQTTMAVRELSATLDNLPTLSAPALVQPEPLTAFVQWQTDTMPVFTGSGIEWFEQELSSVNSSLNALYNTQAQIAAAASHIDWLPDNALADLGNMQNRLQAIWQQVNLIGSNPLNFGSDLVNQELERMRGQLAQAVQQQERLNSAVAGMDVQAANQAYLQLSQTVSGLEGYIRDNVDAQGEFNQLIQEGAANASNLGGMLAGAVKTYLGLAGLRKAFNFGRSSLSAFDVQMNAEVQLATVASNMGMADYYDQILEQAAAIQGRGIYGDEIMIAGAAELSTYFHDGDAVLSMMDTLSNYAVGMSGGGELDYRQMTDYATGLGKVMSGSYDAMTKKGFEFSDAQKAIIEGTASHVMIAETLGAEYLDMSADMQAAAAINQVITESWGGLYEAMSNTPQGQIIQLTNAFGDLQEQIGGQLYPYVMLFVGAFRDNWPTIESVLQGITSGFTVVLGLLSWVAKAGLAFADMLVDNWGWLGPIIYGVAGALTVYYGSQLAANAVGLVSKGIHIAMAAAQMVQAAAMGTLATETARDIALQQGLNAALYACPITWIAIGVIGIAAAFYAAVAAVNHFAGTAFSATGLICGAIATAAAFIGNTFVGLLSGMIQLLWSVFVAPFMGIIEWILNACNGGFDSFGGAVANLIGQIISWFLSLGKVVTTIIDAIFGSDWTSRLKNLQNDVLAWGKNENAVSFAAEMDPANYLSDFHLSYGNAFNAGYGFGENLFNNPFGVQELDMSAYDMLSKGPWEDMGSSLAEIANNTGDMAHDLSMTGEDLKYMRDIAARDTVNRYTTAEIVLNMGGITNNVSKMDDLDGIITHIVDGVNEAVEIASEGLHI